MNKLLTSLKGVGRFLLTPATTAAGAIGGFELGKVAAQRAPRIANQLPYVGMAGGAVVGAVVGQELNERMIGVSLRGKTITIKSDDVVVEVDDIKLAGDEAKRAVTELHPKFAGFTPEELSWAAIRAKQASTNGPAPQPLTTEEVDVVAGDVSESAA